MKQFFLLGASSVYGVGGSNGGWATLLKLHLHQQMYGPGGTGEKFEVFNFAKSGADVQFVLDTFPEQVRQYSRGGEVIAIVSVGGNNSKAIETPQNYVSTVEEYITEMTSLIKLLQKHCSQVLLANNGFVDESKTNPKLNPFDGTKSYFTNARRKLFRDALKRLCTETGVQFIDVGVDMSDWQRDYLYKDGLHPNDAGHQLIADAIISSLTL